MSWLTPVMVNGLPSKRARDIGRAVANAEGFELFPYAYAAPGTTDLRDNVEEQDIGLIHPNGRREFLEKNRGKFPEDLIVVDSLPSALDEKISHYCDNRWNFIAEYECIDLRAMEERVQIAGIVAVMIDERTSPSDIIYSLRFLKGKVASGEKGRVYSMKDFPRVA